MLMRLKLKQVPLLWSENVHDFYLILRLILSLFLGCEIRYFSAFHTITNVYIKVVPCKCKYPLSFIEFFLKHLHVLMSWRPEDYDCVHVKNYRIAKRSTN